MKRLLMVTLLLLFASAFISCNSYDVEGKPEVASNPAKKVFSYYPWDSNNNQNPDETTTDEEVTDETVVDNEVNDDTVTDDTVTDDTVTDGEVADDTVTDEEATDDDAAVLALKAELPESITQEFEIYNRGVTGTLKIFKINMLDPDGNQIEVIDNASYKNLFKIQIQKTASGIIQEGWNEKLLTFDNMAATEGSNIAELCPLDMNATGDVKKCKKSFKETKYNPQFKVLLSYNQKAAAELTKNPPADYKISGDFSIEICTNDPSKQKTLTCGNNATSYKIQVTRQPNKPPKPIIKVLFEYTTGGEMSYRNLKDKVSMNLKNTCVSDPDKAEDSRTCLANWEKRYYIKYKWEMTESPTPLIDKSKIKLPDSDKGSAGQWLLDSSDGNNPKRAEFTGLMITPRKYAEENSSYNEKSCNDICGNTEPSNTSDEFYFLDLSNYLICRQKYCEKFKTKYYKINIQAETVDKQTDLVSDTADITVLPKIIPQARVVAQLTWDKGYKTSSEWDKGGGVQVDLDIHMVKRTSLEAPIYGYTPLEGVIGTFALPDGEGPNFDSSVDEKYYRHDDCYFGDSGLGAAGDQTIKWKASLDIDNKWGGNNFETPETIGLGPIEDKDGNGIPDEEIIDDQYLIVVNYFTCTSSFLDGVDRCAENYKSDDSAYEVNTRVEIFVDGVDTPRPARVQSGTEVRTADNYATTSKNFILKPNEWKVVAVVKWDPSLPAPEANPLYPGDGIVSDTAMTDEGISTDAQKYKICKYPSSEAVLVPIWSPDDYYAFVDQPLDPGVEGSPSIGVCY
ncbi:MAG TPA: hypothetical protein PKG52_01235 [bacterium]|nr:hypothetical protein [bacterium]HPS31154.1 hypothetical protein [bacterium]